MSIDIKTNNSFLSDLLSKSASGELQLPDFQRGWVWTDYHIRSLLASVSLSYPIGALMTLQAGNPDVKFQTRVLEGVTLEPTPEPKILLLDGQQRLTSLFQALKSLEPVHTHVRRGGKKVQRHYYANIEACIDLQLDREEEGIVSVPEDRKVRSDFGRRIDIDLSSQDGEIAAQMFPLDIIFDAAATNKWQYKYVQQGPGYQDDLFEKWNQFHDKVISQFLSYQVPTIELGWKTRKEAVCQVFEKVNTGGVTLTVFELLTATYAADNFELRKDWEARANRLKQYKLLGKIDATAFLQIVTLLTSYSQRREHLAKHPDDTKAPAITCKRRDILRLSLEDYKKWAEFAEDGLKRVIPFLHYQYIFHYKDLPYTTQLVPLGTIFGWLKGSVQSYVARGQLKRWFWCGVLGEMYGGANESRFALDVEGCIAWIESGSDSDLPRTIQTAQFQAERLLSLRTRNSAAYKGLHALQMKQGAKDLKTGQAINVAAYFDHAIDIHHIFPKSWCRTNEINSDLANCIVNKTALSAHTNRKIGGSAPGTYLSRIQSKDGIEPHILDSFLRSHDIDPVALRNDDFEQFFNLRFERLLSHVEHAMGKPINRQPGDNPFAIEPSNRVEQLIQDGESATVEFKSTARYNMYTKERDEAISWAVIKTIAAFMNTDGGSLLIGVNDDGAPVGIDLDFPFVKGNNRDGWWLWITTTIKNALGAVAASDIQVHYCTLNDRTIALLEVRRGSNPTFAKKKGNPNKVFFVRLHNATEALSGPELLKFQKQFWPE